MLWGVQRLVRALPEQKAGSTIYVPACGTGQILDHLADASRAASKIVLADLSAALLAVARARAQRAPHLADGRAAVEVVRADVQAFSPPPGTVDLVLVTYALTMIPDPAKALATMWASLKEGGILGIADFTRLGAGRAGPRARGRVALALRARRRPPARGRPRARGRAAPARA